MRLSIFKPKVINIITAIIVFSFPLLRERARLPDGTITEVVYYQPIYLLISYLKMHDWKAVFLMIGFFLIIYFSTSIIIGSVSILIQKLNVKNKR